MPRIQDGNVKPFVLCYGLPQLRQATTQAGRELNQLTHEDYRDKSRKLAHTYLSQLRPCPRAAIRTLLASQPHTLAFIR